MTMALVATSSEEGSAVVGGLLVLGGAVCIAAYLAWDRRRHPFVPRRCCGGTGIRRSRWNGKAIGPCRRHDGKHWRRRWGSGIQ